MEEKLGKMKYYIVTRIVKEVYSVEAKNKTDAIRINGEKGNPVEVTVLKETAKPVK